MDTHLAITIFLIATGFLGLTFLGNNRLSVSTYTLPIPELPKAFEGFTILQISDLHNKRFGHSQKRLLRKISSAQPDICVVTGDFVMSYRKTAPNTLTLFRLLAEQWPTYAVTGNHETHNRNWPMIQNEVLNAGVVILDEPIELRQGDEAAYIMGIDDPTRFSREKEKSRQEMAKRLSALVSSIGESYRLIILLSHRPELLNVYSSLDINIAFSGHAHGGLWRLPLGNSGLIAPDQGIFPKHISGVHHRGKTFLVISRGLGAAKLPLRLFNPPELVVVRLIGH